MDLDKEFMNWKEAKRLDLRGKELVEDKFIVMPTLWRRQVVEPFSGARYLGEPYKVPESDHFSIARPADRCAIQHRLPVQFVDSFLKGTRTVTDFSTLPIRVSKSDISNRLLIAGVESTCSSLETFEIVPGQNAVVFDNATMGFAIRALSLREEGSRFDGIHVSCLQQLVEAIVLHDIILVPALSKSPWLEHAPVDLTQCEIHIVSIPPGLDSLVRDEAVVWLSEWMKDNAARGLIARLLHIHKDHWERKGLSLERHTAYIPDVAGIKDFLTAIWEEFVSYSSTHHLSAPGRPYSVDEWHGWLKSVRSHGLSLLHWLVYRPFYYHILAGYIWKIPYCAHPSRGLALAFESFERIRCRFSATCKNAPRLPLTIWKIAADCDRRPHGPNLLGLALIEVGKNLDSVQLGKLKDVILAGFDERGSEAHACKGQMPHLGVQGEEHHGQVRSRTDVQAVSSLVGPARDAKIRPKQPGEMLHLREPGIERSGQDRRRVDVRVWSSHVGPAREAKIRPEQLRAIVEAAENEERRQTQFGLEGKFTKDLEHGMPK